MRNLDWNEGAPDELVTGMIVEDGFGELSIIGHADHLLSDEPASDESMAEQMSAIARWAWLIKPYQLEWLESMNKQHGKGKK